MTPRRIARGAGLALALMAATAQAQHQPREEGRGNARPEARQGAADARDVRDEQRQPRGTNPSPPREDTPAPETDPPVDDGAAPAQRPPDPAVPADDTPDAPESSPSPVAAPRSDAAGLDYLAVLLQVLFAACLGGIIGHFWSRTQLKPLHRQAREHQFVLATMAAQLKEIQTELTALKARIDAQAPASDRGRERSGETALREGSGSSGSRGAGLLSRLSENESGWGGGAGAPDQAGMIKSYNDLLAGGLPKRRDFSAMIASFRHLRGIQMTETGRVEVGVYSEDDPNELLVALGNGGDMLIVPTYDYLSNFGSQFNRIVQNPPLIQQFFALEADESGQPRLGKPARAVINEAGQIQLREQGRLAGFLR